MLNGNVRPFVAVVVFLAVLAFASTPVRAQVGLWQFEEGGGNVAGDGSAFGNDGDLVGGAAFADDPDRGSVMSFDGTGYGATNAFVTEMGDSSFTCVFWIRTDQAGGAIVSKQSDDEEYVRIEKQLFASAGPPDDSSHTPGAIIYTGTADERLTVRFADRSESPLGAFRDDEAIDRIRRPRV